MYRNSIILKFLSLSSKYLWSGKRKKQTNLFPFCGSYFYFLIKHYRNVFDIIKLPGLFLLYAFISSFCLVLLPFFTLTNTFISSNYFIRCLCSVSVYGNSTVRKLVFCFYITH